jgi:hypothetical protein
VVSGSLRHFAHGVIEIVAGATAIRPVRVVWTKPSLVDVLGVVQTGAAVEGVDAVFAVEVIIACVAVKGVLAVAEGVVVVAAFDVVVAQAAFDAVVAGIQRVRALLVDQVHFFPLRF